MTLKMSKIITNNNGTASIETALLLLPFILIIAIIIESCILTYQTILIDHQIDIAAKYASSFKGNIKDKFEEYIEKEKEKLLSFVKKEEISIKYCKSIEMLSEDKCEDKESKESKIAVFTFKHELKPMFLISRIKTEPEFIVAKSIQYIERP